MAELRPFRAVRYNPTFATNLADVVCAPYDVIDETAQRAYYDRSPYNVIRLELGETRPTDTPGSDRYSRAAETYGTWRSGGVLAQDARAGFYVVEEAYDTLDQTLVRRSLVAPVRLAEWEERIVLPHEQTMARPKADRLSLLRAAHTQISPILALYDSRQDIDDVLDAVTANPPIAALDIAPGAIAAAARGHRLWQITDPNHLATISSAFADQPIYMADGHHRYETALAFRREQRERHGASPDRPSECVLMYLTSTTNPGLIVLPTHRIVTGLAHFDSSEILRRLQEIFQVEARPRSNGQQLGAEIAPASNQESSQPVFGLIGLEPGVLHRITVRDEAKIDALLTSLPPALRQLDVALLQRLILEPILGINESAADSGRYLHYTRDTAEAVAQVQAGRAQLALILNATPVSQITAIARANARMPQKSTYFYPKPVTGLTMFDLADS